MKSLEGRLVWARLSSHSTYPDLQCVRRFRCAPQKVTSWLSNITRKTILVVKSAQYGLSHHLESQDEKLSMALNRDVNARRRISYAGADRSGRGNE